MYVRKHRLARNMHVHTYIHVHHCMWYPHHENVVCFESLFLDSSDGNTAGFHMS